MDKREYKMDKREYKNKIYDELAKIAKAVANPHRIEIIEMLAQGPYSVEQLSILTNMSVANTSQHLQILKTAQVVSFKRDGNFIYYRLADRNVYKGWKALRDVGMDRMASLEKIARDFRQTKFKYESVTIKELVKRIRKGEVTILDVRPETEFKYGHIPNSISIPIDQLAKRLKGLSKKNEIVAYCRGPFCVFADEAVALLRKEGYRAIRLSEGFPDWASMGLPIEQN